jgi:ribosomal protein S18 acetylase RimI-like enzyme
VQLREVPLSDPSVAPLLDWLAGAYRTWYGAPDEVAPGEFEPPAGAFVVLLDDTGVTVAGGGFRRVEDGVCEVKRVWTAPGHRRRGHASRVLAELERLAGERGYRRLRLETGPAQPEAEAMYRARGYRHTPWHAHYPSALAFEKELAGPPGASS